MTHVEGTLVSIKLLGPFRIIKGMAPLPDLPVKASACLAFLAMQGEPVSRERLAELVWPDREREQSRQSLRQAMLFIRRSLGDLADDVIKTHRGGTAISLSGVSVDAHELDGNDDDELDAVTSRAQLYCGEFLAGFPSISNQFDEWALLERSKASNAIARLLGKLASLQIRHGHFEAAVSTAQRLVSLDPLREDSHRVLMEIYAKAGRRAEALRQYETCAQILKTELNVAPDVETTVLAKRLRKVGCAEVFDRTAVAQDPPEQLNRAGTPATKDERDNVVRAESRLNTDARKAQVTLPLLQAERRQLTVMLCKLLNAGDLFVALDPEDFRCVMATFRTHLEDAARKFGGALTQQLDDGVIAYFGHPLSRENDAERAVRAALEFVHNLPGATPAPPLNLETSVGIASGLVVVEEASKGATQFPSGAPPHFAAQLQSQAKAGEVIICEATRRLLGQFFQFEAVTETPSQRSRGSRKAYRVLQDRALVSRFEALRANRLTPFIGRDEELDLLRRRWKQVASGEGRAVLLCGEPGIGKSRVIHEFRQELAGIDYICLEYCCSPLHAQSDLYPLRAGFERAASIKSSDSSHVRLKKIENLWRGASLKGRLKEYRIIADLLGVQEGGAELKEGGRPQE